MKNKTIVDGHLIPIYGIPFIFIINPSDKKYAIKKIKQIEKRFKTSWIARVFDDTISEETYDRVYAVSWDIYYDSMHAFIVQLNGRVCEKDIDSVLVHELCHTTDRAFNYLGIPPTLDNSEPRAYFIEYLFEYCKDIINKNTKK